MTEPVRVIKAGELVAADPTPGMLRMRAFELPIGYPLVFGVLRWYAMEEPPRRGDIRARHQ